MKKVYTVKIQKACKPNIWYANKIGREFEVELNQYGAIVGFIVTGAIKHFIYPVDCKIINEVLIEGY